MELKFVNVLAITVIIVMPFISTFPINAQPNSNMANGTLGNTYLDANFTTNFGIGSNVTGFNAAGIAGMGASNIRLATFGGWFVYQVWQQQVANKSNDIFVAASQDGGRTFNKPIDLNNHTTATINSTNPQIGAFGDDVYITWIGKDIDTKKGHVFLINSTDGGSTFGTAVDLNNANSQLSVSEYTLLVDKDTGKVLIAWIDDNGPNSYCGVRC